MAMKARRRPSWKVWRKMTRPGEQTSGAQVRIVKGYVQRPDPVPAQA